MNNPLSQPDGDLRHNTSPPSVVTPREPTPQVLNAAAGITNNQKKAKSGDEDDKNDDLQIDVQKGLSAETVRSHWSTPILLYFRSDNREAQFLLEEYYRCRWRLFLNTFVWMVIGVVYRHYRPSIRFLMDPLAVSGGVASFLQLLLIIFDKVVIKPRENTARKDAENNKKKKSAKEQHSSSGKERPRRSSAARGSMTTDHALAVTDEQQISSLVDVQQQQQPSAELMCEDEDEVKLLLSPIRTKHVYVQEILASVWTIYQAVLLTYLMAEVQNEGHCKFLFHHVEGEKDAGIFCNARANQYLLWTTFIPIVVGQPRFHIVAFGYCVTFITAIVTHNVHNVSPGGQVILLVLFALYLVMLTVLKYFNEVQLRKRFVLRKLTDEHRRQAEWGNRALKEFVLQITPKHLHTKLREASGVLTADASTNATCVVVQIHDSLAFIHSVLPTKAAAIFSFLFLEVTKSAERVGLEHIRTHGDTSILVRNLAASHDPDVLVDDKEAHKLEMLFEFALSLHQLGRQLDRTMNVVCGIAQGALVGMPLGSSCIHYDLFGPALSRATKLAASCEPTKIHVDETLCQTLEATRRVEVQGQPSELYSEQSSMGPSTTESSVVSNDTTLSNTGEVYARMVSAVVKHLHMLKTLTSSSVGVPGPRSASSTSVVSSSSTPHLPVQRSITTSSSSSLPTTNQSSEDVLAFDPISALALELAASSSSMGVMKDGGAVAVQLANSTKQKHSLAIIKSWCFVTEFSDPDVQEQATKCIQQDTTFSFFLVNVFIALFLAVCCASVAEERGSKADEDLAPLLVYFILTALCIVVFSVLAVLAWKEHRAAQPRHLLRGICLITMFVSLVACHFARRSAVGDDPGFLLYVVCLLAMHIGVSAKTLIIFQSSSLFVGYIALLFAFRILIVSGNFFPIFGVLVIVNALLVNNEVDMTLHAQLLASEAAIAEVREQEQIQQRILAAIIPPGLHYVFEDTISMFNVNRNRFDCWGEDEAVVLHLNFVMPDLEKVLATEENTSGYSSEVVPPSIFTPSVVQAIKRNAEETSGLIERLVGNVQHKSLNVVKVLGGTMVVAGPIINSEKLKASSTRDLDELRLLVEQCIEDAVELVATLFKESGLVTKPTVGVALEQTIDCLIVNNKPSFDLLGQAVNLAKGIADAAPAAGMAVATEKFASRAEALPSCNNAISFGSGESWRLRNLGSVRVRSVHT